MGPENIGAKEVLGGAAGGAGSNLSKLANLKEGETTTDAVRDSLVKNADGILVPKDGGDYTEDQLGYLETFYAGAQPGTPEHDAMVKIQGQLDANATDAVRNSLVKNADGILVPKDGGDYTEDQLGYLETFYAGAQPGTPEHDAMVKIQGQLATNSVYEQEAADRQFREDYTEQLDQTRQTLKVNDQGILVPASGANEYTQDQINVLVEEWGSGPNDQVKFDAYMKIFDDYHAKNGGTHPLK